jgi:type II secretory pathway pseudopilin PulG
LIEALAVIAILAIVALLALSAIQAARETARRAECANHLRQLAIATAAHHSAHGAFPAGLLVNGRTSRGGRFSSISPLGTLAQLLPYLDLTHVFNNINIRYNLSSFREANPVATGPSNATVLATTVAALLCPSDGNSGRGGTSYAASTGALPWGTETSVTTRGGGGVFPMFATVSSAGIHDGSSQTIGIAERARGSGQNHSFNSRRDVWMSALDEVRMPRDADDMTKVCASLIPPPQEYWPRSGEIWLGAGYANSQYNHVALPNSEICDCDVASRRDANSTPMGGSFSARSGHPGGVHAMFMDGSAKFMKDGINLQIWRSLGTRAGGEAIPADSY